MTIETLPGVRRGYVNLFYLASEYRGRGLADQLQSYVDGYMRVRSIRTLRLKAARTNLTALRFYAKHGWREIGSHDQDPGVAVFERVVAGDRT